MHRWNLILRVFTLEYLGLTPASASGGKRDMHAAQGNKRHHELVSGCPGCQELGGLVC